MVSDSEGVVEFLGKLWDNDGNLLEKRQDHLVQETQVFFGRAFLFVFEVEVEGHCLQFLLSFFFILIFELIVELLIPLEVLRKRFSTWAEVGGVNNHL